MYDYALKSLANTQPTTTNTPPPPAPNNYGYNPGYANSPYPDPSQGNGVRPPTPEEWQMDPGKAYALQREYDEATRYQPIIGGLQSQVASTNLALLQSRYPKEFSKWGPEIVQVVNSVRLENRTYDALERVVQIVRSNHVDDLVEERWAARMKDVPAQDVSLRSGAAPGTGAPLANTVDFNELPQGYRDYLSINRVDQSTLDEFLSGPAGSLYGASLNDRRKGFIEAAKGGDVRTERPLKDEGGVTTTSNTKLQITES